LKKIFFCGLCVLCGEKNIFYGFIKLEDKKYNPVSGMILTFWETVLILFELMIIRYILST